MEYGKKLPASNGKTGVIGFCWGGAAASATPRPADPQRRRRLLRRCARLRATTRWRRRWPTSRRRCSACTPATTRASAPRFPRPEAAMKKLGKSYECTPTRAPDTASCSRRRGAGGANLKAAAGILAGRAAVLQEAPAVAADVWALREKSLHPWREPFLAIQRSNNLPSSLTVNGGNEANSFLKSDLRVMQSVGLFPEFWMRKLVPLRA